MMLVATPFMAVTPPLLKRRRLNDFDFPPETKRRHLYPEIESGIQLRSGNAKQNGIYHSSQASYFPSLRRRASIKAEVQLSNIFNEECSPAPASDGRSSTSERSCHEYRLNGCTSSVPEVIDLVDKDGKVDDEIPVVNLKKHRVKMSESLIIETFSTPSDVDSDCSESGRTSISKSKIKQPAIVLMKMNQPVKKKSTASASPSPRPRSPEVPNVVFGGYVHRMANLNARACVAAYLEPEKKYAPKRCKAKSKSMTIATVKSQVEPQKVELDVVQNGDDSVIKFEDNGIKERPSSASIESGEVKHSDSVDEVRYNKEGLLYNGDTIHPSAQVFLSGMSFLKVPARILPKLVPTKLSTVKRAAQKAISTGVLHMDKKQSKKNNGWHPLGEPVKVIEHQEGSSKKKTRKYYVGIRRRGEEIFVRDCVVIKADDGDDEKPYVAKIGGIWQEPDGHLMMTTFWYYRPDDVKIQNLVIDCVGRELLASQHHDTNSVACIEDKCYVLGYSQYCRYHASVVKSTIINPFSGPSSTPLVPELPMSIQAATSHVHDCLDIDNDDINLVELDSDKQQFKDRAMGPPLSDLQHIDPFLVFLCYRGFNHISGKVQNYKPMKM